MFYQNIVSETSNEMKHKKVPIYMNAILIYNRYVALFLNYFYILFLK